jgi:hypothetical protein
MFTHSFRGFQLLHGVLLALAAVGFFIFWARTRFWLPKYAHILAGIGLAVGIWCVSTVTDDAPISKKGPVVKFLSALVVPAIVYFFFVFYGGQQAAFRRKPKNANEIADIVERFLNGTSLYPQEWHEFIARTHDDALLDSYRKRCYELDPLVNRPDSRDARALADLRGLVQELRRLSTLG